VDVVVVERPGQTDEGQHVVSQSTFALGPRPPFRLDLTVWALRRRADNAVDRWDGATYRRALVVGETAVAMAVTQVGPPDEPRLQVTVEAPRLPPEAAPAARQALDRLLGLQVDLASFYRLAAGDARLAGLARRFRGLKPPCFPAPFEALANAIACQQVTLTQGIRLLNLLAAGYGRSAGSAGDAGKPAGPEAVHAFPRPDDLTAAAPEALRALGLSRQKARALGEAARAVVTGQLDPAALAGLDDATAVARLCALHGVGRWTAEYVLLRGLGRLHVFPGDDVGARTNLRRWLGLEQALDYDGVSRTIARWQPYGGLIYFHLLLDRLAEVGLAQLEFVPADGSARSMSRRRPVSAHEACTEAMRDAPSTTGRREEQET
jgi:DNA-3-methyladenine glycosylase II